MNSKHKAVKPAAKKAEVLDSATSSTNKCVAVVKANSVQEVEVVGQVEPLDVADKELLKQLEDTIRIGFKGFSEVYDAFGIIHDKRLYREQYNTFAEYCHEVWDMSRSQGHRYLSFIKCVENLKCRQSATKEPLAIPANEMQARKLATLKPEQQEEVAKKVAKKTSKPTAKDFDEEAEKYIEDRPRVQSYDLRDKGEADDAKDTEAVVVPVKFDTNLVSFAELKKRADEIYYIYTNPSKKQEALKLIFSLKQDLEAWAEWQEKQINLQEAA